MMTSAVGRGLVRHSELKIESLGHAPFNAEINQFSSSFAYDLHIRILFSVVVGYRGGDNRLLSDVNLSDVSLHNSCRTSSSFTYRSSSFAYRAALDKSIKTQEAITIETRDLIEITRR